MNTFKTVISYKYYYVTLFVIILGIVLCDFGILFDYALKSKWYWFYITIPIGTLLFFTIKSKKIGKVQYSRYLIILFIYCLIRVIIIEQYVLPFIVFWLLLFLAYSLIINLPDKESFTIVSGTIVVAVLVVILYSTLQYIGIISSGNVFRFIGTFDNPAGYISFLTISIPFILYFTLHGNKKIKYIAWIVYMLTVISIILSMYRTGILTVLVISFLYVLKYRNSLFWNTGIKKMLLCILIIAVMSGFYFVKKDSADGRILIWKCTWEMIKDKPLFGHGYNSFEAKYMLYQADYFAQNPESKFILLSDNTKHPFNEMMLLIVEFGLVGFLLMILFITNLILTCRENKTTNLFTVKLVLLAIIIFSCFSYPFQYPFTWLAMVFIVKEMSVSSIIHMGNKPYKRFMLFIILSSIVIFTQTIKKIYFENKWYSIANSRLSNKYELISEYESIYPHLESNAYFLYNYAAYLNYFNNYATSLKLTSVCKNSLNDYDIQMIIADNYTNMEQLDNAETCYITAHNMIPNRFMPLYKLMNLYGTINNRQKALDIAKIIIDKPVKIPSGTINSIKREAQGIVNLSKPNGY